MTNPPVQERSNKRVSTRRGGVARGAPSHANTEAFRHNRNSQKTQYILSLPVRGLCSHCTEVIEWRKKYRKYKPLTTPKKCTKCLQKTIKDAYHVICDPCAMKLEQCAKCLISDKEACTPQPTPVDLIKAKQAEEAYVARLSERARRTHLRQRENGILDDEEVARRVAAALKLQDDELDSGESVDDEFSDNDNSDAGSLSEEDSLSGKNEDDSESDECDS